MDVNKAKELLRNNALKAVEQPLATPPVEEPLSIRGGIIDNEPSNAMLGAVDLLGCFGSVMDTEIEELKDLEPLPRKEKEIERLKEIEDLEPLPREEMKSELSLEDFTEEKETELEVKEIAKAKPVVKEGVKYKLAFVPEPILGVLGELVETPIEQVLEIKGTKYALVDLNTFADSVE